MKIICIGRNYALHAKELHNEIPDEPVIFCKPDSALSKSKKPFFIPDFTDDVHHEVEIVVRINRTGKHIQKKFAHKYFNEIAIGIDFTARDVQSKLKAKGLPWEKAKGFDGAAPVSNFISTQNLDLTNLSFHLENNGKTVQSGNTADMLFDIHELIAQTSKYFTLKIGDLIFTGTPAGVARVQQGDNLTAFIENELLLEIPVR